MHGYGGLAGRGAGSFYSPYFAQRPSDRAGPSRLLQQFIDAEEVEEVGDWWLDVAHA